MCNEGTDKCLLSGLARIMHKFSTAAAKSSALPALRSIGLLNVLKSTFAGAWGTRLRVTRLVRIGAFAAS